MELKALSELLLVILEVAFGLGFVIFVHELGHFAVAKWCGVKCEKFYLGFDIGGLKLFKFKSGETEYGIGILPLGGYVKMLGQDDNPARAAEERERSKLHSQAAGGAEMPAGTASAAGEEPLDPRSYMAKSVPQRMAIISAGVIMNVIFAFFMAVIAYRLGVKDMPCAVSEVLPGEAAWRADIRPGDRIVQIDDQDPSLPPRFRDLKAAVALGSTEEGVRFKIAREDLNDPQETKEFWVTIKPDAAQSKEARLAPTIGAVPLMTTTLAKKKPVADDTPAAKTGKFKGGDKLVAVGDVETDNYAELDAQLARHPDERLSFQVERDGEADHKGAKKREPERVSIDVDPNPRKLLGLVMKMGRITAIQENSPAAAEDLRAEDGLVSIDGVAPGDPMTLPERLRRRAGETVTITVSRTAANGRQETLDKHVTLRQPDWSEPQHARGSSVSVPVLGIAYKVLNVIEAVDPQGPAAAADVMEGKQRSARPRVSPGDEVAQSEVVPANPDAPTDLERAWQKPPLKFGELTNWPLMMDIVQRLPTGAKIRLTLVDGRSFELLPSTSREWFNSDRGFNLEPALMTVVAQDWRQAVSMGARETKESLLQVYMFIRAIFAGRVSVRGLGGPKMIAEAAGSAAYEGISALLIFLTMLSANLAVINFLPIPLLDGGHMVFLVLEGIRGKPVSERVVVAFHYLGFAFIIGLMLFVLSLDFGIIPRFHL